ncbi:MAG: diguanylate cyclase [Woeseia sp.]|jgi:diguanylate cyclase (GGDEF)-like protein|nr:diguanylate cyclase [Woeseia sp.]MBT6209443.1 diguanylate cyclase [Woeseia sp.]
MAYATSCRTDRPVSVLVTDIVRFKQVNDEFGRSRGDDALFEFSELLKLSR